MNNSQRPQGITILAILAAIGGVFGILGSLALIGLGGVVAAVGGAGVGGLAMIFGLLTLALSAAELAFAYGAWTLKPWGWSLGVAVSIGSIAISLLTTVTGGGLNLVGLAINGVILYYLNTPAVKSAFGRS